MKGKSCFAFSCANKYKQPEKYVHHLLILYFPFGDEADPFAADSTYSSKLDEQNVLQIIQANKSLIESHADEVDHIEHVLSKHSENPSIRKC